MKKLVVLFILFFLIISCESEPDKITKITATTNQIDSLLLHDSTVVREYLPYREKMVEEVNKIISYAPENLVRTDGKLQSSLGNLLADLLYEKANRLFEKETGKKVDFSFSNYGGIRAGIWKGDVKVKNAFNLMPFENTIVVAELTSEKVGELFEYFLIKNEAHPISKQVQITLVNDTPKILINGKPINHNKTYFVATSDYLQKGGGDMNFFAAPESLYESNFLVREAIIDYFKSKDTLVSRLDNRVVEK